MTLHLSKCSIPSYLCVRHQTHPAYSSNSDKLYWTPVPHSHRYYARSGVIAPLYFRVLLTPQMAQLGAGSPGFGGVGLCSSLFYALSPPSRERLLRLPSTFSPHTAVKLTIKGDRLQKRKGTSVHMARSRFWIMDYEDVGMLRRVNQDFKIKSSKLEARQMCTASRFRM